ncbi:PAS domain-containing protein [Roseomonas sp. BN140053]|uniref:hybrid sensor histidine kinase/response regulator n=1 Tax=Roseomonas sp. BN140053 TaxID=3391898 RepID=UPI0039EB9AD1
MAARRRRPGNGGGRRAWVAEQHDHGFLSDGGEMGARLRSFGWAGFPAASPEHWPLALRSAVGLMLGSRFPMFLLWGEGGACLYNDAYIPMLGCRHPAALGRRFQDIWPEAWPEIGPLIRRAYAGEATFFQDFPLTLERNGAPEQTWFTFSYSPLRDAEGRIPGMFCAAVETTGKMLAEAALRAREAELRQLNETLERQVAERTRERDRVWRNTQDLLAVLDADGIFRAANPAWTTILGYAPAEVVGRGLPDFLHPEDAAPTRESLLRAAPGAAQQFENRFRHRDGEYRWFSWRAVPEGELLYASGRHITAEKQRAAELELAQDALRQSQKMEAVGQLTGGIAHDFNNLLQGIIGSLDLVRKRLDGGRAAESGRFVDAAAASAQRAAALTHRLLAFARRQPLDPRPVRVNALVASMEELLRRTLGERIALEFVLGGGLWLTRCDQNQLESALLNLAINARDAMPAGGRLTIETANAHLDSTYAAQLRDVKPGQYVCLSVTDTGTGMTPDVAERAFDPFFTTKPIGQGTGLGLSMIYGFTRQSEGYARIYSEFGQGTTVKLYLPRFRGEGEVEEALPELSPAHQAEDGETVLVVEDEPVVRGLMLEVLHELGYRALEAADGLAELDILRSRRRIDLLLTDIGLPGLNGRQLAEAAREARPGLKVLFMTGYAENATLASGFLEPGMAMITKPFAMEHMATRVREMMETPGPTPAA